MAQPSCFQRHRLAPPALSAGLLLVLVGSLLAQPPEATSPKRPLPEKAERDQKLAEILKVFTLEKNRTVEQRHKVVVELIATGRDTKNDPGAEFALFNLAREQAAEAGQIMLALEALDELAGRFEFDSGAIRVATFEQALKANLPPAGKREILAAGIDSIDVLAAAEQFDRAIILSDRLAVLARSLRDAQSTKLLGDQRKALDAAAAELKRVQLARTTLERSPHDREANLALGRYQLVIKKDWTAALGHLANGSEALLAAAAKAELAGPQTTADQEKVADAWWNAAAAQKDAELKQLVRARSGEKYREIVGELVGLPKAKAELRLKELGDAAAAAHLAIREILPKKPTELLPFVDPTRHAVKQTWTRRGDDIVAPRAYAPLLQIPVTINGAYELTVEFTRETGNDIVGVLLPVGDRYCNVLFATGGGDGGHIGNGTKGEVKVSPFQFASGKRHVIKAKVFLIDNVPVIDVLFDDRKFDRWAGEGATNEGGDRKVPAKRLIGLYAHDSQTAFHSVKLTMLSGKAIPEAPHPR